jgi:hypothetical protein
MALVTLTVHTPNRTTAVSFVDSHTGITSADTVSVPNDERTVLILDAAAGANVTVVTPNTVDTLAVSDKVLAAGTAKISVFGPFPKRYYGSTLTLTTSANVDVLALSLA